MAVFCFDFDGTIADTIALEEKYYLPLFKVRGITQVHSMNDFKIACRENYYEYWEARGISVQTLAEISDAYESALEANHEVFPLFEGAKAMLVNLAETNSVYILSLNAEKKIYEAFDAELHRCITAVYGWESSRNKINSLQRIRQECPGERIIFISDTVGDMKEGREGKADVVIGVSYGWGLKADLAEAGADIVFDDIPTLFTYLKSQN